MAFQIAWGQFELNNVDSLDIFFKMPIDLFHLGWKMHSTSVRLGKRKRAELNTDTGQKCWMEQNKGT